jgi:hypothetical protein
MPNDRAAKCPVAQRLKFFAVILERILDPELQEAWIARRRNLPEGRTG